MSPAAGAFPAPTFPARHSVAILRGLPGAPPSTPTPLTPLELSPAPPTPLYLFHAPPPHTPAVVEVLRQAPRRAAWLLRLPPPATATLDRSGDVAIVSAADALFAALPALRARGEGSFQPADALLVDAAGVCFARALPAAQLALVCDVKDIGGGEQVFRVCEEKVAAWVRRKIAAAAAVPGVSASDACELVCAYLSDDDAAAAALDGKKAVTNAEASGTAAGAAGAVGSDGEKFDGAALALEEMARSARENKRNSIALDRERAREQAKDADGGGGASNGGLAGKRKAATVGAKRKSVGQSRLEKQDKTGIKTMGSYFSRKK